MVADTVRMDGAPSVYINRRDKIGRFLADLHKFAVDFAVNVSQKGLTDGKRLYEILQEGFRGRPASVILHGKRKLEDDKLIMEEEMQESKIENMKNEDKQQSKTAGKQSVAGPQGVKELALQNPNRKRIFIRSRL